MTDKLTVYTDGGCTGNPGPGGWAAVLLKDSEVLEELSGGESATTNNRMEMTAVIKVLEWILRQGQPVPSVELYTDSQYVQKGISEWMKNWLAKGWKTAAGKPVKNRDLWMRMNELAQQVQISWHWVKGHAGHQWNERCDELVAAERAKY